jgi:site-specific DNA-methyltransferase (adenine-specific)
MREPTSPELIHGDCLEQLARYSAGRFALAYLDPPFLTQKHQRLSSRDHTQHFSFSDVWASAEEYAGYLRSRLVEVRRVLSDEGSVFVHCDRNATHILRAVLDDVFGPSRFRAEIIWSYRRWSNAQQGLLPAHQTILYYTKTDEYVFNQILEDYSPTTNVDQILQRRVRDGRGKTVYERDTSGQVVTNGGKPGVPLSDVWDIPYLNPKAKERAGYPTQKPLLLLERIIKLASREGDWVLDPFCGSGTALVAAMLLGRRATGIDVAEDAIRLAEQRCSAINRTDSKMIRLGRDSYRQANADSLALLSGLELAAVQRNNGIDAILAEDVSGRPVLVRVQRPGESLLQAALALEKASTNKNAGLLIVVATRSEGELPSPAALPPTVRVVEAPSLQVRRLLSEPQFRDLKALR